MVGYQAGRELVHLTCQVTSERHVAEIDARLGDGDNGRSDALTIHHSKGGLPVPIRIIDSRNRISDSHTAHGLKVDGGDNVVMNVDPLRLGEACVISSVHVRDPFEKCRVLSRYCLWSCLTDAVRRRAASLARPIARYCLWSCLTDAVRRRAVSLARPIARYCLASCLSEAHSLQLV